MGANTPRLGKHLQLCDHVGFQIAAYVPHGGEFLVQLDGHGGITLHWIGAIGPIVIPTRYGKLTCTRAKALGAVAGGAGSSTVTRSHWASMEVTVWVPVITTKVPKSFERWGV